MLGTFLDLFCKKISPNTIEIDSWDALLAQEKELAAEQWLFRGMQNADWHLETSLERACMKHEKQDLRNAAYLENIITREF